MSQNTSWGSCRSGSETYCSMVVKAASMELTTMPASTSIRIDPRPVTRASQTTNRVVASPTAKAPAITPARPQARKIIREPPNPAPVSTPTVWGPTRGLRKAPCSTAPETARPAPDRAASNVRGSRAFMTMAHW